MPRPQIALTGPDRQTPPPPSAATHPPFTGAEQMMAGQAMPTKHPLRSALDRIAVKVEASFT